METLTLVVVILQVLGAVLSIVVQCYILRSEARKKNQTESAKEKSEPSITAKVAHFDKDGIDILDISIH